jgi:hypothetical protein
MRKNRFRQSTGPALKAAYRAASIFALALAPLAANAQDAAAPKACTIRPTTFKGWQAEEVANNWVQLMIVPQLGGRLMQVTFNKHPYLFVNPKYEGKYIPPEQAAGRWINYGGDKIWPLPEGNDDEQHWTGASTPLDDGAYQFSIVSQNERCAVRLDGPPDPPTGLQYSREISIGSDSPEIDFHAITRNSTGHTINWSVQSVSQYNLADPAAENGFNHNFWAFTPVNPQSAYLNSYHVRDGLANDPSFSVKNGLFRLHWRYIESEVWIDSPGGWVAVVDGASQYAMVEKTRYFANETYPDKATMIFYKNGPTVQLDAHGMPRIARGSVEETPYYMEAEMNSPMVELGPGQTYTMDSHWFPTRLARDFHTVTEAGAVGAPLNVARQGGELELTGSFGVFFPGSLEARLYDEGGAEQSRITLQTVGPADLIDLHRSLPAPAKIVRISLHLIDNNHADRGALGEAFVAGVDTAP